jgi:hypothetical protein
MHDAFSTTLVDFCSSAIFINAPSDASLLKLHSYTAISECIQKEIYPPVSNTLLIFILLAAHPETSFLTVFWILLGAVRLNGLWHARGTVFQFARVTMYLWLRMIVQQ